MLSSILETRKIQDGLHKINLDINEKEYFFAYSDLNEDDALDLLKNYLLYNVDDGQPNNIEIKHKKNEHLISISADLHYTDNDKTIDMYNTSH